MLAVYLPLHDDTANILSADWEKLQVLVGENENTAKRSEVLLFKCHQLGSEIIPTERQSNSRQLNIFHLL